MNRRRQFCAAALCWVVAATGCQSSGQKNVPLLQRMQAQSQPHNKDLKDPERLYVAYGRINEQSGDLDNARTSYESAIEENPQSVEAILGLARLDLLAGRVHEAERRFLKAIEVRPGDPSVIESAGQFYLTQDRLDDAINQLAKGVELAPANKRLRQKLGIALARNGRIAAAEQQFVQAVGEAEADYNIGLILYEQGAVQASEQRFLDAVLKKPTLAQAQHWLDAVRQEMTDSAAGAQPVQQAAAQDHPRNGPLTREAAYAALPEHERVDLAQIAGQPDEQLGPSQRVEPRQAGQSLQQPGTGEAQSIFKQRTPKRPAVPEINPSTMTATQLEQLENSMSPDELARFRASMRNGRSTAN
jgi:Flp pilus assembly protein TadD